jgi:peptide chain release factor 1
VTVAVLGSLAADVRPYQSRNVDDYIVEWFSGSGAGGSHRNKNQNSARVTHVPTGIIRSAQTRSRENSFKSARSAIDQELDRLTTSVASGVENHSRRQQVGSGERSDKRRTFRFQDGLVHDHITQKTIPVDRAMNGRLDLLWPTE